MCVWQKSNRQAAKSYLWCACSDELVERSDRVRAAGRGSGLCAATCIGGVVERQWHCIGIDIARRHDHRRERHVERGGEQQQQQYHQWQQQQQQQQ
jgi:hypothetical protein